MRAAVVSAFCLALFAFAAPARAERINVVLDQAKVMSLPEGTKTVVVGNPAIADVAVQKNGLVVLTGKAYGMTNLIAIDHSGKIIAESDLFVQPPTEGMVMVQRGMERETYSCTPRCAPAMVPGDVNAFYSGIGAQMLARNQLATTPPPSK